MEMNWFELWFADKKGALMRSLFYLLVLAGVFVSAWFDPRILLVGGFCILCQCVWLKMHGKPIID